MTSLEESAVLAARLLENWDEACRSSFTRHPAPPRGSWQEERQEVLEAILAELRAEEPGRDSLAACRYLLQHLAFGPSTAS
jgi:hypothetical protein